MINLTKRQMEIAYLMLKHVAKQNLSLKNIANSKRDVGNASKEIGIPEKELLEFGEIVVRECFEEQMAVGFRPPMVRVID